MKKQCLIALLLLVALVFCGCGRGTEAAPVMEVSASDHVVLPDYSAYTMAKEDLELSKEELGDIILFNLSYNEAYKPVSDRKTLAESDIAVIDFEIVVDGSLWASEKNCTYILGSGELPADFERQLIGQSVGEKQTFDVSFPEDFFDEQVAGLVGHATVFLKEIRAFAEISDEAFLLEHYGCDSMEEVYEQFRVQAEQKMKFDFAYNKLLEESRLLSFPVQGTAYVEEMLTLYRSEAESFGMDWETYLTTVLETEEDSLRKGMEAFYKEFLTVKAVAEREGFSYSRKDYLQMAEQLGRWDGMTQEEVLEYYHPITICYEMMKADLEEILPAKIFVEG